MKKKLSIRCLLGAPVGVTISLIITVIFSLCLGHGEFLPASPDLIEWCGGNETVAVIVQIICASVIGAACSGASVIYEIEKWSLLKQTLINFAVIAVPFFGIGYVINWMPHNIYGALSYVGGFIVCYVILWCSIYFSIKAKIKRFNKKLCESTESVKQEQDRPIE